MEISNGNNFYMIKQNNILFWGMDIPIREIIISKFLREFIDKNDFSINEVYEFNQLEDLELFSLVYGIDITQVC
jgi:hypothetical protein